MNQLSRQTAENTESVVALASRLIRTPSRGGIDDYGPVLSILEDWLEAHRLPQRRLHSPEGELVGVVVEVAGCRAGPTWVLDACVDTAPFGDEQVWSFSPTSGDVVSGWLQGRGAADSKLAASLYCHLAAEFSQRSAGMSGNLAVLLDCDEHTGGFGGARAYLRDAQALEVAGVIIGYPGLEEVVVGGRGVFRARLHVHGTAGHSGASKPSPANAAVRAAILTGMLSELELPKPTPGGFPLPPKVTVTELLAGQGFTAVPDRATVAVDVRLTDVLDDRTAEELLLKAASDLDLRAPGPMPTTVEPHVSWPPFHLTGEEQPAAALLAGARHAGIEARSKVAGPSNIGNLLASLGIPATAGFGVPYEGLHGTDERVRLDALPAVRSAHRWAMESLLGLHRDQLAQ